MNFVIFLIGIIDYNFLCFKEGITKVFELREKAQQLEFAQDRDREELDEDDNYPLDEHINGGDSVASSHNHNDTGPVLA